MKKQFVKFCLFAAAACAAVVPGWAQSGRIVVKAPFSFTVGQTSFPAGDYMIQEDPSGVVFITNLETRRTIGVLTSADAPDSRGLAAVRFDKADGHYTLTEVVLSDEPSRHVLSSGKRAAK